MKTLADVRILDLSHRLPGPMATKLLSDFGAEVVKLEDEKLKDPFLEGFFATFDPSFMDWYHQLNQQKRVVRVDFKGPHAAAEIQKWCQWADIIIWGLSEKQAKEWGVDEKGLSGAKVVLSMGASRNSKAALHDLNALAEMGFLELHLSDHSPSPCAPPFLPAAGISFGQQIALNALALFHQAKQEKRTLISKVYMLEEVQKAFSPVWSDDLRASGQTKFLHNGAYPCYALYRNKDGGWLAVAAVEEKFWREFVAVLGLNLSPEQRFSPTPEIFAVVAHAIAGHTTAEWNKLLADKDICVSLVRPKAYQQGEKL